MKQKNYLRLYFIVVTLLFVHLFIAKIYSEPYPSLIFPAFAKIYKKQAAYDLPFQEIYVVDSNLDTFSVDRRKLIDKVVPSHIQPMIATLVAKEELLKHRVSKTAASHHKMLLTQRQVFLNRIRKKLKTLFPDKHITYLVIRAGKRKYDLKTKTLANGIYDVKTTVIKLI